MMRPPLLARPASDDRITASLVGAGMIFLLVLRLLAIAIVGRGARPAPETVSLRLRELEEL